MDKNSVAYQMELTLSMVVLLFWVTVCADDSKIISDRYAVYWNSTNPRYEIFNYIQNSEELSIHVFLHLKNKPLVVFTAVCKLP